MSLRGISAPTLTVATTGGDGQQAHFCRASLKPAACTISISDSSMAYDYDIFPARNLAVVSASGRITGHDIVETIQRMDEDERWVAGMHQICDYLEVKGIALSLSELREIVSLEQLHIEDTRGGKLALLAQGFDMRTMCELFCLMVRLGGREARVFRSREEAVAWLDIPADQTYSATRQE